MAIVFRCFLIQLLLLFGCGRFGFDSLTLTSPQDGSVPISASCLDGVQNQSEAGVDCGGDCPACSAGAKNCAELLANSPGIASGVYQIDSDGDAGPEAPFFAYCEMVEEGGGWTLALKVNGMLDTFRYAEVIWRDSTILNPDLPNLDDSEAKLKTFSVLPFTQIRVGLKYNNAANWVVISGVASPSLLSLFVGGGRINTTLGRAAWEGLLPGASLQANCNREGFNVQDDSNNDYVRTRIGILTNNINDCVVTKATIGIGIGSPDQPLCETIAAGNCDAVDAGANIFAMGYVMVR